MEDQCGVNKMDTFQSCKDISDIEPFYQPKNLFLKPVATLNISVQFPSLRLSGNSISSKMLMDSLRAWVAPECFCSLKVLQSTVEFIRFEGEIENKSKLQAVLNRLDGKAVKIPSFPEQLKVRASIAKPDFPTRHDWDSFFRDAKNMNEMKAGERPDTLHLSDFPCRWFASKSNPDAPSEHIVWKVFEQFGEIQAVDIPSIDPFRNQMKAHISGLKTFSFNQNLVFDAYVQFKDYIAFVKTMDTLRGMKLLKKDANKAFVANIKLPQFQKVDNLPLNPIPRMPRVTFDKTKHLSESSIRKRKIEREKIIAKEVDKEEKEHKLEEVALLKKKEREKNQEEERIKLLKEKDETKKGRVLKKSHNKVEVNYMAKKIATEEKLLLVAQRKLESIRLLSVLLRKIKESKEKDAGNKEEFKVFAHQNRITKKRTNNIKDRRNKELKKSVHERNKKMKSHSSRDQTKDLQEEKINKQGDSDILSESSSDNCRDHTEPLRVRGTFWHGDPKFYRKFGWRGATQLQRWNWSPNGDRNYSGYERKYYTTRHERNRNSIVGTQVLYSVTRQMYYKYFKSISKTSPSRSRSPNTRSSRSWSQSDSRRHLENSSRLKHSRRGKSHTRSRSRSKSNHNSGQRSNTNELNFKCRMDSSENKSSSRSREENGPKQNVRRKTRWGSLSNLKNRSNHKVDEDDRSSERCLSIHTWSRSPSKDREPSWERSCESQTLAKNNLKHRERNQWNQKVGWDRR